MQFLVLIGAMVSLAGVTGLIWCILLALRARREGLDDQAMRTRLQYVVMLNMGALGVSGLGLMLVVAGIFLG